MIKNNSESLWSDSDDDCILLDHPAVSCSTIKKDIPVVKVNSVKKGNQWVSSSFGDFGDFGGSFQTKPEPKRAKTIQPTLKSSFLSQRSLPVKRKLTENVDTSFSSQKPVTRRPNTTPETDLWSDKHSPKSQDDLAVHKKKISDVEDWIKNHLNKKGLPPILLLTGPAGVGKTATVKVLATELGCQLHEWTNPITETYDAGNQEDWRSRSRFDIVGSSSQLSKFRDFLLRANKYNTLDIFGGDVVTKKIICVEDFPNAFYRDAAPFHDILRKYVQVGRSPLVFIVSDSTHGESTERLLFPKNIQEELHIDNIRNCVIQEVSTHIIRG